MYLLKRNILAWELVQGSFSALAQPVARMYTGSDPDAAHDCERSDIVCISRPCHTLGRVAV